MCFDILLCWYINYFILWRQSQKRDWKIFYFNVFNIQACFNIYQEDLTSRCYYLQRFRSYIRPCLCPVIGGILSIISWNSILTGCFIFIYHEEWVRVQSTVTDLMAFLHFNLSLVKLRLKHFLHQSLLTTSFHINFGLRHELCSSTTKFIIFVVHDAFPCQYKWPGNWSLFHVSTSSIC